MEKSIEKALEDVGLGEREVTPFMRVRVVGLNSKISDRKDSPKEGLITIWNPTEKQVNPMVLFCFTLTLLILSLLIPPHPAPFLSTFAPIPQPPYDDYVPFPWISYANTNIM